MSIVMRIVYFTNIIDFHGGLQHVTIVKANALAEIPGNEVTIVVAYCGSGMMPHKLSSKVKLINLAINYDKINWNNSLKSLMDFGLKKRKHAKAIKKVLSELAPDIVISTGKLEKQMIASIKPRPWKTILEYHFEKNYDRVQEQYQVNSIFSFVKKCITSIFGRGATSSDEFYDKVVVLTHRDKDTNWKGWENVTVIPNPVTFKCTKPSDLSQKCVLSLGRLVKTKNFDSLIRSFQLVTKRHPDWVLKIYGEGEERNSLEALISREELQNNVFLCGLSLDVESVLTQSSIFALTSISEGFALSLIEAMECGVPVVSYNCPCGPSEIITQEKDGFLVPMGDEELFAERICSLINKTEMRRQMGIAAKKKAEAFQIGAISRQWMDLFVQLKNR